MDYKSMYLEMFRAATQAIGILQKAQQSTEEKYIAGYEPIIRIVPPHDDDDGEE